MRAEHWLLGYIECRVRAAHASCFMNLCHEYGVAYLPLAWEEDSLLVRCRRAYERSLMTACAARGIGICVVRRGGLPAVCYRYRRRLGLFLGLLLAAVLLTVSSRTLWDVRVEGGDGEAEQLLADCGLRVGAWIPALDVDAIESRVLTESDGVAWVSVNLRGSVAYVQLRPLLRPESARRTQTTNLVAACDGVIESVRLIAGEAVVHSGELVRAGQLLVAGVRDSTALGYATSAAQGEVMARVEDTVSVRLPRAMEQKVYGETQILEKNLFFFGKSIKITKKSGIIEQNCDTIKRIETLTLPSGASLPVSVETTLAQYYEMREITLTDEELTARAYEQLGLALAEATQGAALLAKSVQSELPDTGILLTCRYRCVKNIAQPLTFETDGGEAEQGTRSAIYQSKKGSYDGFGKKNGECAER